MFRRQTILRFPRGFAARRAVSATTSCGAFLGSVASAIPLRFPRCYLSGGTPIGPDGGTAPDATAATDSGCTGDAAQATASTARKIQIAVVGSGPSGCFVASYLTKKSPSIHVDVFERLPVSFGLCRYGVAPDHPDVRNVEKQFLELFRSGRATWIGNVHVGREIPVEAMLQHYAAVVVSTGADSSKKLNIPGEELGGVISARDIVSYYNTLPFPLGSPRFCPFDLERTSRVAVVGNGNVAMDVVRVLSGSYRYFCETDMNCVALKELMKNRIRQIDVLGRRGPEHSAFVMAEFREMTRFQEGSVAVQVDPFDLSSAVARKGAHGNARAHKRLMELVQKFTVSEGAMAADMRAMAADARGMPIASPVQPPEDSAAAAWSTATKTQCNGAGGSTTSKTAASASSSSSREAGTSPSSTTRGPCTVRFRYHLAPIAVLPSATRKNYVGGLLCERTGIAVSGDDAVATPNTSYCVIPCDLVVKSIGYRSDRVPGIPFNETAGVIPNAKGRVEGLPRVYCSGWVKNGAKGVILHSVVDAQETVESILEDIDAKVIPTVGDDAADTAGDGTATLPPMTSQITTMYGKYGLVDYFVSKKLEPVSVGGLERILHVERERGIDLGKRSEKLDAVRDMLDVALGGEVGKKADERIRGITPARAEAMMYLKELLDDDTDLAPFAHSIAKDMPRKLAEQHPTGRIAPTQL